MTASTLTVASIQMVSAPDVPSNLATAARLVAQAADAGAQLVVLPEYFALMGLNDTDKVKAREPWGDGPIQRAAAWPSGPYNTQLLYTLSGSGASSGKVPPTSHS